MTQKTITVAEFAKQINATIRGDANAIINGVNALKDAFPGNISFLGNRKYQDQVKESHASVILIAKDCELEDCDKTFLICEDPSVAFSSAIEFFAPDPVYFKPGVHPSATIGENVKLGKDVYIGPGCILEPNVEVGDETVLVGNVYLGHSVKIGCKNLIYSNVSIRERCIVGNKCILHPGVVLGADGFGFVAGTRGIIKIPQLGIVQIDDDVEIGANATIDRARFGKTWVKSGTKIDNLVVVAHNVTIGESSMLIAQSGVAGSSVIGNGVIIAAKAGINGHISIGDGAKVAGTSGVVKSLPPGAIAIGTPAESQRDFISRLSLPNKVEKLAAKIKNLEAQLNALQNNQK